MAVAVPAQRTKHHHDHGGARPSSMRPGPAALELPSAWLVAGRSAAALVLFIVAVVGVPVAALLALTALL